MTKQKVEEVEKKFSQLEEHEQLARKLQAAEEDNNADDDDVVVLRTTTTTTINRRNEREVQERGS